MEQISENITLRGKGLFVSQNSSNTHIFEKSKSIYQTELANSGYNKYALKFDNDKKKTQLDNRSKKKTRKRKIIWFSPPYNKQVTTRVGHTFIELIKKTLPQTPRTE